MTSFEYLSVLLSIILGLAVTQILQGYRSLLLARASVAIDATALLWSVLVLLLAMQAWWASFGLEGVRGWRFDVFAVIMLQMALIYMMAALVLPDVAPTAPIDLAAHYEAQRRPFFICLFGVVVVSIVKDVMLDGVLPEAANLGFHAAIATVAVIGTTRTGARIRLILPVITVTLFILYVAILFARLDG